MPNQQRFWYFALVLLLAATLLPSVAVHAQQNPPGGTATPDIGGPGVVFTFTATGFRSGELINLWLTRPDGSSQSVGDTPATTRPAADSTGTVQWQWSPSDISPDGQWQAVARGEVSRVVVKIPFQVVTGVGDVPPSSWFADPPNGPPGTTFTFVGRSPEFIFREQLSSWFIQPDGSVLNVDQGMSIDPNGQFFRLWRAPDDAQGGEWIFRVVGISSNFNIDIPFRIDGPSVSPNAPPPPVLQVEPDIARPGVTLSFTAGGFRGGEIVTTWLARPDGSSQDALSYTRADSSGLIFWNWEIPDTAPAGVWRLVVRGVQTGGLREIPFIIERDTPLPPPPPAAAGTVQPAVGLPDERFFFTASGFRPDELVRFWLEEPGGVPYETTSEIRADADGNLTWDWKAPRLAVGGQWVMITRGRLSGTRVRIPFTVEPVARPPQQGTNQPTNRVAAGSEIDFFARGFERGELVQTWVEGPDGYARYFPDRNAKGDEGLVEWDWFVPRDQPAGLYRTIAQSFLNRTRVIIDFEVTRDTPAPQESPTSVTPASGTRGTTFTFRAAYEPGERVSYWLTDPDGRTVRATDEGTRDQVVANDAGIAVIEWTAPADALRGQWTMNTRTTEPGSIDDDISYVIPFTIE